MLTRHGPGTFDTYFTSLLTLIHLFNIYVLLIYKYSLIIHVLIVYIYSLHLILTFVSHSVVYNLHTCTNQLNSLWSMASAIL